MAPPNNVVSWYISYCNLQKEHTQSTMKEITKCYCFFVFIQGEGERKVKI
jgi:hypothetical protein